MKKRSLIPETRVKNPEPGKYNDDWIIWAAWADRITFEEIEKKTVGILQKGLDLSYLHTKYGRVSTKNDVTMAKKRIFPIKIRK